MLHRTHYIVSFIIFFAALTSVGVRAADIEVVVLRNGQVFRGAVFDEGERLVVQLENVGEIVLPRAQVEIRCYSLDEAFRFRLSLLHHENVKGHLELAEWALRHRLYAEAAEALLVVQLRAPRNLHLTELRRRLLQATQPTPREQIGTHYPDSPSREETAQVLAEFHPHVVREFTESIQPLLWNNCLAGGCHTPGSGNPLPMLKSPGGTKPTGRLTQRNLVSVIAYIGGETAEESPLLRAARTVHGGGSSVLESERRPYYQLLKQWVELARSPTTAVARETETAPASIRAPEPPLLQPDAGSQRSEPQRAPKRDPFAPEFFNRRHFPERFAETPATD